MVAVAFENGQVYVGNEITQIAEAMPPIHPAALLFPTKDYDGCMLLAEHIRQRGLRHPIVMTPTGELLEGRGRWYACQTIGVTPTTRVERADPWLYILRRHQEYLATLTAPHRAMIGGQVPRWTSTRAASAARIYGDPPRLEDIALAVDVTRSSISRSQMIYWDGIPELHQIVIEGRVPVFTAARVSEVSHDEQRNFVTRVRNGENPKFIAPQDRLHPDGRRNRSRGLAEPPPARSKNQVVRTQTVRQLIDVLRGVKLVVEAAEGGLDPAITPQEAADFVRALSSSHVGYGRLNALLKERKQEES